MKTLLNKIYESPVAQLAIMVWVIALFIYTLPDSKAVPPQRVGFFAPFERGQKVAVKETPQGFEIHYPDYELGPLAYTVVEVGSDYIVVEDFAKITETRISIYSIRYIKSIKAKGK